MLLLSLLLFLAIIIIIIIIINALFIFWHCANHNKRWVKAKNIVACRIRSHGLIYVH